MSTTYEQIYNVVRRIPHGRVATYGQIAELAGLPRQPRMVGYALSALSEYLSIPWHRVINAKGEVSVRSEPDFDQFQRTLLEDEGIEFDAKNRISLTRFRWKPRSVW